MTPTGNSSVIKNARFFITIGGRVLLQERLVRDFFCEQEGEMIIERNSANDIDILRKHDLQGNVRTFDPETIVEYEDTGRKITLAQYLNERPRVR